MRCMKPLVNTGIRDGCKYRRYSENGFYESSHITNAMVSHGCKHVAVVINGHVAIRLVAFTSTMRSYAHNHSCR